MRLQNLLPRNITAIMVRKRIVYMPLKLKIDHKKSVNEENALPEMIFSTPV
jgi:hypothetical protein